MSFWLTVLAVMVADFLWAVITSVINVVRERIPERGNKRRIGFEGGQNEGGSKGTQMRRIGFGEHD